jgi:hypothetical protein
MIYLIVIMEKKTSVNFDNLPTVAEVLKLLPAIKVKYKKSTRKMMDKLRKEVWGD